jgi:hypothetical protein
VGGGQLERESEAFRLYKTAEEFLEQLAGYCTVVDHDVNA